MHACISLFSSFLDACMHACRLSRDMHHHGRIFSIQLINHWCCNFTKSTFHIFVQKIVVLSFSFFFFVKMHIHASTHIGFCWNCRVAFLFREFALHARVVSWHQKIPRLMFCRIHYVCMPCRAMPWCLPWWTLKQSFVEGRRQASKLCSAMHTHRKRYLLLQKFICMQSGYIYIYAANNNNIGCIQHS